MTRPSEESACARCARVLVRSCCQVEGHEQLATLTLSDVARVAEATGLSARRFTEEEGLGEEAAHDYESRRPLYRDYFRRAPVRLTLARKGGACVFFRSEGGCTLSAAVRPTACRLYPFELWPGGEWSLQVDRYGDAGEARASGAACLAVEEATSMEAVLDAFGTTREEVEALGRQLADEVRHHAQGRATRLSPGVDPG